MKLPAVCAVMVGFGCQQDVKPAPTPAPAVAPAPVAPVAPPVAPAPVAPVLAAPPAMTCAAPSPARDKQIRTQLTQRLQAEHNEGPFEITPICELASGWMVTATVHSTETWNVADKPTPDQTRTVWLVPARGAAVLLYQWAIGPVLDFDGDGKPEVSTWYLGRSELKIWFDAGRKPGYLTMPPSWSEAPRWTQLDGDPVVLHGEGEPDLAVRFRRDRSRALLSPADCARAAGGPCATPAAPPTPVDDPRIAAVLGHRKTASRSVQPDAAVQARLAAAIEADLLAKLEPDGVVSAPELTWGCTSGGETPVLVRAERESDAGVTAWYRVRGERFTREAILRSSTPDEWTDFPHLELAGHADFDGDGVDESIVVEERGKPVGARYRVRLGGQLRELPASEVYRGADGARDGVVRLRPFAERATPDTCVPETPDSCQPSGPPTGWWVRKLAASWDWAHDAPEILVWRGDRFTALARPAVEAIIDETAAARAPLFARP